jgi:calcineurin-like phosphoesterase family protein
LLPPTSIRYLGHANIIRYCNRPFKDVDEMNETIIKNFNEVVREDDVVYHNGDFCFKNTPGGKAGEGVVGVKAYDYIKRLNGRWVFLKGNHDKNNSLKTKLKSCVIEFANKSMYMTHKPQDANPDFEINLVGHVHDVWLIKRLNEKSVMYNVGVDVHNFRPVPLDKVITDINRWLKEENNGEQKGTTETKEESRYSEVDKQIL